jgi:uncharacterized protein
MTRALPIAKASHELCLLPALANRHGLIAGATGTGKTVTLQTMAEAFSSIGVPVFMADVKGDLAGLSQAGSMNPKLKERVDKLALPDFSFTACPTVFWDVYGALGHPVRATVSEMGPLLLARLLNLNETQGGVLNLVFKIADDQGLLLLDLKDLRAMVQHVGDNARQFTTQYGNISAASIGAIQRGLMAIDEQGGDHFFGEPALNISDLMQTDDKGRGIISILAAEKLMNAPKAYATLLLWLLSELFEQLPEVGDPEKPKLVFFFDEAHLLFTDAEPVLLNKIEQVIRLIRSKGVGVYFVTQNPLDVPDTVLGQLGNRVQHALRAFTPRDQKAVNTAATTLRAEALVSFLDEKGIPAVVERAFVLPPHSRMGSITMDERTAAIKSSTVAGVYEQVVDRESAYEVLKERRQQAAATPASPAPGPATSSAGSIFGDVLGSVFGQGNSHRQSAGEAMVKSAARAIGSEVGRQIMRGVLGSILGGTGRRR